MSAELRLYADEFSVVKWTLDRKGGTWDMVDVEVLRPHLRFPQLHRSEFQAEYRLPPCTIRLRLSLPPLLVRPSPSAFIGQANSQDLR
jgi:hypothetical protein